MQALAAELSGWRRKIPLRHKFPRKLTSFQHWFPEPSNVQIPFPNGPAGVEL